MDHYEIIRLFICTVTSKKFHQFQHLGYLICNLFLLQKASTRIYRASISPDGSLLKQKHVADCNHKGVEIDQIS